MKFLLLALLSLSASAADYTQLAGAKVVYTVAAAGKFSDTVTITIPKSKDPSGPWYLLDIVQVRSVAFIDYDEAGNYASYIQGPDGVITPLQAGDLPKLWCYQYAGEQLRLLDGWRFYGIMGASYTVHVAGTALLPNARYFVQLKRASDDGCRR